MTSHNNFSRAAHRYDDYAIVQSEILREAVQYADAYRRADMHILDTGCGTGALARHWPNANIIQLDMAEGMCHNAASRHPTICASAEALPLQDASIDLYFSSLCWQWLGSLEVAIFDMLRVLQPDGTAIIATLIEGTCRELSECYTACNIKVPSLHYPTITHLHQLCKQSGGAIAFSHTDTFRQPYSNALTMLRHLHYIGAALSTPQNTLTPKELRRIIDYMDTHYREKDGVSLHYQVAYLGIRHA